MNSRMRQFNSTADYATKPKRREYEGTKTQEVAAFAGIFVVLPVTFLDAVKGG